MAEYLQTVDWISSDMSILELGCGPGLAGLGAAEFTTDITVSDYEKEAIELAELNWLHTVGTSPKKLLLDWRDPQGRQFDLLLAADVAYEKRFFEPLIIRLEQ
jgi:methylase of polypeptide subunit release factors